ncbi:MAG: DNA repair protein RecN [Chitinophagales bacterium]|nr:DNA repair protein RecN [Chitinophagales bacterium]
MLKNIEIQNYAIIDKLNIEFTKGLTIITGETGAGKSILLGALELIRGKRADTKVLFNQDIKCYVEAVFDVQEYGLKPYFDEEGLEYHDELIIRREIAPNGKSRAFVNDTPVTLDILQTLADGLIDIHQQFDTLDIQKPAFQMRILDALAENKTLLADYGDLYKKYRKTIKAYQDLQERNRNANQELEFLNFQMQEFLQADIKENELENLEVSLQKLTASEDIKKMHALLVQVLDDNEMSVNSQMQTVLNAYSSIKDLDAEYSQIYERLVSIREELKDLTKEAMHVYEITEYDEEEIQNVAQRLDTINRMLKKHQVTTTQDLLSIASDIENRLNGFADMSHTLSTFDKEIKAMEVELEKLAGELTERRKKIVQGLEKDVHDLLVLLSMEHAYIRVDIHELPDFTPTGKDEVSFMFAPNKGSEFLPLKDTASGGEMSRLTLCIKSLVAGAVTLPTWILDEIDAGVSGDVAQKMGKIMADLSANHQLICITHAPQIAARAERHYWVYKFDNDQRTVTAIKALKEEERILEIAKMLSGNPPTQAAIANACELIAAQ